VFYLEKFIWPFGLSAFYPVPEMGQSLGFEYYAALAAVIALTGLLVWFAVHGRARTWVFGLLFFLIALAPSSRFVPVGLRFLAADRFFYLPGIGLFLLLSYGIIRMFQMRPAMRYPAACLVVALCILWSAGTWERSRVWRTDESLWRDTLAKCPDSAYVLGGLAQTLAAKDIEEAGRLADKALALSSKDGQVMLVKAYQCQKTGEFEACLDWLAKAESRGVNEAHVALMVGRTYSLMGDHARAIRSYARVLKSEPQSMESWAWIAVSHLALDDEAAALETLKRMQAVNVSLSESVRLLNETVPIYSLLSPLDQALCLVPDLMRYQYELCQSSQFVLKDKQRARKEYRRLLKHYPLVVDVWRDVANQIPARHWPVQVYDIRENHIRKLAVAFYNQACLLEARGKSAEAVAHLDRAIQYDRSLRRNAVADNDLASLRGHIDFVRIVQPSAVSSQMAEHVQALAGPTTL
ncbi:MAG: tetratricopeptide repeat protein, partial [Kiritimatiellae bacterium]|nr:tetratricopeptide repeat protein [Kiritimatiellia bacterium]